MADLTPQMRDVVEKMRSLAAAYQQQHELLLTMIEHALWEVQNSRPSNYTGAPRDKSIRDQRRKALIEALEATLATAGRDVSRLRRARDPATGTGD